ncbi:hypothetical protein J6590_062380 [Homalodisca vitripennis]|nr:hypothetical protein J6590_062380 [Homalodisca vitripennis]
MRGGGRNYSDTSCSRFSPNGTNVSTCRPPKHFCITATCRVMLGPAACPPSFFYYTTSFSRDPLIILSYFR